MNKPLDLTGKIPSEIVEPLITITPILEELNIPFLIVGATARDLFFHSAYGIETLRATIDIDFGIEITTWNTYQKLSEALDNNANFIKDKEVQRYYFKGENNSIPIDIVPFGSIEETDSTISWPPDHDTFMSILGFKEALQHSQSILISNKPNIELQIATPVGQAIMKIISWNDRRLSNTKDAQDLRFLIENYINPSNRNLSPEHVDLYDDIDLAPARLLGRDIIKIVQNKTLKAIIQILETQTESMEQSNLFKNMLTRYETTDAPKNIFNSLVALKDTLTQKQT